METPKVEQQQTTETSGNKPPDVQTPVKGSELSAEQKVIIGLKAENARLKNKAPDESVSSVTTDDSPDDDNKLPWVEQKKLEKQLANLTRTNRVMEAEIAQGKLDSAKEQASREHGIPKELFEDAKKADDIYRRISQWYVDIKNGNPEEKTEVPARTEHLEGGGKGIVTPAQIFQMSPEDFEKYKQTLRVKRR